MNKECNYLSCGAEVDSTMMYCEACGRKIRCKYCLTTTGAHRIHCYRLKHPLKRGERAHYNQKTPEQVSGVEEILEISRPKVVKTL